MPNTTSEIVKDHCGKLSAMRVAFITMSFFILLVWGMMCYIEKKLVDLPPNLLLLTQTGYVAKVGQSFVEKKSTDAPKS